MTDKQFSILSQCAGMAVYVRPCDRRESEFDALIRDGMAHIAAGRVEPTRRGWDVLRGISDAR